MHGHDAGRRVVLSVDSVEQMVVANADLDRYEAEVIPDLLTLVRELTSALAVLEAAVTDEGAASQDLLTALARARRVLAGRRAGES